MKWKILVIIIVICILHFSFTSTHCYPLVGLWREGTYSLKWDSNHPINNHRLLMYSFLQHESTAAIAKREITEQISTPLARVRTQTSDVRDRRSNHWATRANNNNSSSFNSAISF